MEDRIVSLHMPFVRPIVRGKSSADVEFSIKLAISTVNGFSFMENFSFDVFNEGTTLIDLINNYYRHFVCYPAEVIVDKIYRNRENITYYKSLGIRLSGPPLGRPSKDAEVHKHNNGRKEWMQRLETGSRPYLEKENVVTALVGFLARLREMRR